MCYVPNEKGKYAKGMEIKAKYLDLSGYRLPTEAEWELACRAGSVTTWSMGDAEDLLGKYAWYDANSKSRSHPAGSLRPNDLGLFDMCGNNSEWCSDWYWASAKYDKRSPGPKGLLAKELERVLRGGAWWDKSLYVHSAHRLGLEPEFYNYYTGFRPARTFR
jgi:formylglycine-generating enzyme required for sulfatase activity